MTTGRLLHICVSERKGTCKTPVSEAALRADHGIVDDAHAGPGGRQISLLAREDIDLMRARGLTLAAGAFGENLVVEGIAVAELEVGTELHIGPVRLRITQVGKTCHHRCAIYDKTGDCIMPRRGVFAEVVLGGILRAGLAVSVMSARTRRQPVATNEGASRA